MKLEVFKFWYDPTPVSKGSEQKQWKQSQGARKDSS